MDFNFKKLTDEEVSTSVNLTDEIFFAVNGEIRKATVSQLVKAVATNVQTVTENGKYVVDARELNPRASGTFAQRVMHSETKNLDTGYGNISFVRKGNMVRFYGGLTKLPKSTKIKIPGIPFKGFAMALSAYDPNGIFGPLSDCSIWIDSTGTILEIYKTASREAMYISGVYMYDDNV